MIKEQELLEAIAECQGERNPNANTCIKLAAYYIILDNIKEKAQIPTYSFSEPPGQVRYDSGSEFSEAIKGLDADKVYDIIDELMDAVQVMIPKLYRATIERLKNA